MNKTVWSERDYRNYLESNSWKCGPSPLGAHHWHLNLSETVMRCIHCGIDKSFTPFPILDVYNFPYIKESHKPIEEVLSV